MIKVDGSQAGIVDALRGAGCSVTVTCAMGGGFPDLVVGRGGRTYLIECKTPLGKRNPRPAPLTPPQERWHRDWRGQVAIVTSAEEALRVVGLLP